MSDKSKSPIAPVFTPVPEKSRPGARPVTLHDEEVPSGVHDVADLWRKVDGRTTQLLEYAQETAGLAASASESALAATVRLDEQGKRIDSMEQSLREGHNCVRDATFEAQAKVNEQHQQQITSALEQLQTDIQEGIKTRGMAQTAQSKAEEAKGDLEKNETDRKGAWRAFWGTVVSAVVAIGLASVGAVYYFGQLDERVTQQNAHQVEATKRIESQVKQINTKIGRIDDGARIDRLTKAVKASNGHETTEEYCSGLSDRTVALIKRATPPAEWPDCRRFQR